MARSRNVNKGQQNRAIAGRLQVANVGECWSGDAWQTGDLPGAREHPKGDTGASESLRLCIRTVRPRLLFLCTGYWAGIGSRRRRQNPTKADFAFFRHWWYTEGKNRKRAGAAETARLMAQVMKAPRRKRVYTNPLKVTNHLGRVFRYVLTAFLQHRCTASKGAIRNHKPPDH